MTDDDVQLMREALEDIYRTAPAWGEDCSYLVAKTCLEAICHAPGA